jgi:hypothetical protein
MFDDRCSGCFASYMSSECLTSRVALLALLDPVAFSQCCVRRYSRCALRLWPEMSPCRLAGVSRCVFTMYACRGICWVACSPVIGRHLFQCILPLVLCPGFWIGFSLLGFVVVSLRGDERRSCASASREGTLSASARWFPCPRCGLFTALWVHCAGGARYLLFRRKVFAGSVLECVAVATAIDDI